MKITGTTVDFCCKALMQYTLRGEISVIDTWNHQRDDGKAELVIRSHVTMPGGGVSYVSEMLFDYCPFCGAKLDEAAT